MKKILSVLTAFVAVVFMSGCDIPGFSSGSSSTPAPNRVCLDKLIASFSTSKSNGIWECATPLLKARWFNSNTQILDKTTGRSESWNSDKDINLWLQDISQYYLSQSVQEFSGNPLNYYDAHNNLIGYQYLITVWAQFLDGTYASQGTPFIVTIDLKGQLLDLQ